MPERIPQSVAIRVPMQAYLAGTSSPATGKTIPVTISKNGAAYANPSAGATNLVEVGSGGYYVDLSTADVGTPGPLLVKGVEGTIDTIVAIYHVVNSHNGGFDGVPAVVAGANNGLPLGDAFGRVDVGRILGTASSAAAGYVAQDPAQTIPANPAAGTVAEAWFCADQRVARRGVAQGGTSTTIVLDAGASSVDGTYVGYEVKLTGGTGAGQWGTVTNYLGSTKVATVARLGGTGGWTTAPDNTTTFLLIPFPLANLGFVLGTPAQMSGAVDANLKQILGTSVTEGAAGRLAGGFTAFLNVASPVLTIGSANQTGDTFARVGAAGAGLTAIGDARIANLDATVTSRQATFTAATSISFPTNFNLLDITPAGKINRVVTTDAATTVTNPVVLGTDTLAVLATIQSKTDALPVAPAAVGSPMTLADNSITDNTIAFPGEVAGRPTKFLAVVRRLWEKASNKIVRNRQNGQVVLRNAADTANLETWTQSTTGATGAEVDTIGKGA